MERHRRLSEIWNWLPAFRTAAESEHLQGAADLLGVSPPALSRTIRLLEDTMGAPLFRRNQGKRLELTEFGARLARTTRECMRRLDDVIFADARTEHGDVIHVACEMPLALLLSGDPLVRFTRLHRETVPRVRAVRCGEVPTLLTRGDIDVAFVTRAAERNDLVVQRVGTLTRSIYCSSEHPLAKISAACFEDLLAHSFVVADATEEHDAADEGWPVEHVRRVGLRSALVEVRLEACRSMGMLAVLPDAIVARARDGDAFHRIPLDVLPAASIYAVLRASLDSAPTPAHALADCVRESLAQLS